MSAHDAAATPGEAIQVTCPECSGVLRQGDGGSTTHFECLIGHSFTSERLLVQHAEQVKRQLSIAARVLVEHAVLERRLAHELQVGGFGEAAVQLEREAANLEDQSTQLERLLRAPA